MNREEQQALLTIALQAAFADGTKTDSERTEVKRIVESLAGDLNPAAIYQDVLLKRVDVNAAAVRLTSPELRQLAYELAVGVCDADGLRNDVENRFLAELGAALGLSQPAMSESASLADELAITPLAPAGVARKPATAPAAGMDARQNELDGMILKYSILNGALELLPQSMASLAIIPLQMKMVYRIGNAYGFTLDRGHIKDLLATMGVGLTGQYLEDIGRKLIGGLLGKAAGRTVGTLGRGATGAAFSFATTYALGQVAQRYYAGGRTMSTQMLQETFTSVLSRAKLLQQQHQPQIEEQARTVDLTQIAQFVRNQ